MERRRPRKRALGRPKGSTGAETEQRILDAARECFGARGFGATTNKQVADAVGITSAAIYRYFPSKTALFVATVDRALAELEPELRAAAADAEPGLAEIAALARSAADVHTRKPYLAAFLSSLPVEMQRHPEIAEAMGTDPDPMTTLVAGAVERAVDRDELPIDTDAAAIVSMILACNLGLSLWVSAILPDAGTAPVHAFSELVSGTLFKNEDDPAT